MHTVAFWLFALHAFAGLPAASSVEGSYVAKTLNGKALPADLRIPAQQGDFRLFRLEQGVLRLSSGGRFTLYFRYYHQLVRRGTKPTATPVLSDSESGTYRIENGNMVLTPTKKKGTKSRPEIGATITGQSINASYILETGTTREHVTLALQRDPHFW